MNGNEIIDEGKQMGNKIPEKRISGTGYDPGTPEGKASLKRLKHYKASAGGKRCEIDIEKIREIIAAYVDPGSRRETRPGKGAAEEVFYAPISRPGLRLKLGIDRETYGAWLMGFAEKEHADGGYAANMELADAMREGDDAIAKFLAENNDSGSSAKYIKLLEAMGEFSPAAEQLNNSLTETKGFIWGDGPAAIKWAKRAE